MAYRKPILVLLSASVLSVVVAACGGGTLNAPAVPTTAPSTVPGTPTPPPIPATVPFSVSTAAPLPAVTAPPAGQTPAPVSVALPASSGFGGSLSLAVGSASSIPPNTQVIESLSSQVPTGAPTTFAVKRAQTVQTMSSALLPILYLQLAFSGGVSLANQPTVSFTVPSNVIVSGASYYVALYDTTRPDLGWQLGFEGPGTISGTTISFAGGAGSFDFTAFAPYFFALYAQSASAPTPTPAPTQSPTPVPTATPTPGATPTPIPSPAFGVSPSSISLYAIGATQSITATGSGPYFAFTSDPSIVTVSPSNGNSPFTATAVSAGAAQITLVDSTGKQAIIPVTVTTVSIPVQ